ncbi:MAG: RIP metalloprotease RseP [Chloroflexi bacterium]|nr:RIP metalloprotease RseP [Chloroflexota bacterium]
MPNIFSSATTILIFAALLGVLVFVHEFGHFIVAKRLGIPVLEFGFGFPPRLFRFMKRGETEYTINAIPLGGFVRLLGEEDPSVPGGFAMAKPSVRAPVLLAGVTMNLLLAYVVFCITTFFSPPYVSLQTTRVVGVVPNSPAAEAGLRAGDYITAINGADVKDNFPLLSQTLRDNAGKPVSLSIQRAARALDPISATPRVTPPPGEGPLGIALMPYLGLRVMSVDAGSSAERAGVRAGDVLVFFVDPKGRTLKDQNELIEYTRTHPGLRIEWHIAREGRFIDPDPIAVQIPETVTAVNATLGARLETALWEAPIVGAQELWRIVATIPASIAQLTRGPVPQNSFIGFVGIAQATGEVAQRGGAIALLEWLGLLSLNLAVVNLLPFPALDGGRLVFVALEVLRGGKKVDPHKEGLVHFVGIAVLLGLMLIITFFDVQRLLSGGSIFNLP